MATSATVSTANGIAKKVYGKVQDLVPAETCVVTNMIPYDRETKIGADYNEQIWLSGEHGFTHGGTSGAELTLNTPAVAKSELATATPESLHFRSRTTIELMSRAQAKGEASFENYMKRLLVNSKKAFDLRREARLIYGGLSLGTVGTGDAGTATTWSPIVSEATWAPWMWVGGVTRACDAYDGATKLNTTGDITITSVNPKTRTIAFSMASADATAIKAIGTNGSTVTLYNKGGYSTTSVGLKYLAKTTSSDTRYGIAASGYPDFWAATQVTWDVTSDDFTWRILQNGLEESFGRGSAGDRVAIVPPNVWTDLNSSLDALRAFDSSYSVKTTEMGREIDSITYRSLGFKIKVVCSGAVMGGDVIVIPDPKTNDDVRRVGSSPMTFELPDKGGEMFVQIYGTNLVEHGAFADEVLWAPCIRDMLYFGA